MKVTNEDLQHAIDQGFLEERDGDYVFTEKGLQQLMYQYAAEPDYREMAYEIAHETNQTPPVFEIYYLTNQKIWFTLVGDAVWSASDPETLVNKLVEYHEQINEEGKADVRRYTH